MEAQTNFPGLLLRRGRLAKGWSQEGLCKGICAVSYLSKIEKGSAVPSDEILALLLQRLGLAWHGAQAARQAGDLAERLYDAVTAADHLRADRLFAELDAHREEYGNGPYMLDLAVLELYREAPPAAPFPLEDFADVMTPRQAALWLLATGRDPARAVRLAPSPFAWMACGRESYWAGHYNQAVQELQQGFALAGEACLPYVMLNCQLFLGNCYSDMNQFEPMLRHYRLAQRLAEALREEELLYIIRYNIASSQIQQGRYEEAYRFFHGEARGMLALHKLAICCEKLGLRQEALAALDRAGAAPPGRMARDDAGLMCQVVRYRVEHPGYRQDPAYGALLLDCFAMLREKFPQGYAGFHLPWVEEWYIANRQYKQAWALLRDFPEYIALSENKEEN